MKRQNILKPHLTLFSALFITVSKGRVTKRALLRLNYNHYLTMIQRSIIAAAAALALATSSAFAGTIYSTTGTGTEFYGVGTSIANGHRGYEYGDQIVLPSEGYSFTGMTFDYYSASLGGSMNLNIYANDGALISGAASPGTKLLSVPNIGISSGVNTATFDYAPYVAQYGALKLPKNFTVSVSFSGATAAADKGLLIGGSSSTSGQPHQNVGVSGDDFWQKTGPGGSDWALRKLDNGIQADNFKISVTANVPEPTTVALGVVGAAFLGASALRRNRR
jgi:hypothetical protein